MSLSNEEEVTFREFLGVLVSSAGVFASVLGVFLSHATRKNGEATRELLRGEEQITGELIHSIEQHWAEVLDRMDKRADERHREVLELFDRMDRRTEERHREVTRGIGALKAV